MRGLYAIADVDFLSTRRIDVLSFAKAVLTARPAVLQLRAKSLGARDTLTLLRALVPLARAASVPLFANDRPDLAVLAGCDGVHVGQSDLPPSDVRRFSPSLRVGISTHTDAELTGALDARPDYVAFGPVFGTSSKNAPEPTVGVTALGAAAVRARRAGISFCAIGGIDASRIPEVRPHADLVAVISALVPESGLPGVSERASALGALLLGP